MKHRTEIKSAVSVVKDVKLVAKEVCINGSNTGSVHKNVDFL